MNRLDILKTAYSLTSGDRNQTHGDAYEQHKRVADTVNALLGLNLKASDVAIIMAVVKMARIYSGGHNIDDYIDGAAYMGIAGECKEVENDNTQ